MSRFHSFHCFHQIGSERAGRERTKTPGEKEKRRKRKDLAFRKKSTPESLPRQLFLTLFLSKSHTSPLAVSLSSLLTPLIKTKFFPMQTKGGEEGKKKKKTQRQGSHSSAVASSPPSSRLSFTRSFDSAFLRAPTYPCLLNLGAQLLFRNDFFLLFLLLLLLFLFLLVLSFFFSFSKENRRRHRPPSNHKYEFDSHK